MRLAPAGTEREADLRYRYEIDGDGALTAATAYGPSGDLKVRGTAEDSSGHTAESVVSLRETTAAYCENLPPSVRCL
jgi:hypothetical protein